MLSRKRFPGQNTVRVHVHNYANTKLRERRQRLIVYTGVNVLFSSPRSVTDQKIGSVPWFVEVGVVLVSFLTSGPTERGINRERWRRSLVSIRSNQSNECSKYVEIEGETTHRTRLIKKSTDFLKEFLNKQISMYSSYDRLWPRTYK